MTGSPLEAWCPGCRVTHVPGTKRCIHCGGTVLPERPVQAFGNTVRVTRPGTASPLPDAPAPNDPEADATAGAARPLRIGMAAIWVLLAIGTAILRACSDRG